MVKTRVWLRPPGSALFLFGLITLMNLLMGYMSSTSVDEFGWWMPAMFLAITVFGVQASGAGVRLDPDQLVIRGGLSERHVPRSRVVGLEFVTSLDVVVKGGRSYTTSLKQTNLRPGPERFEELGRLLAGDLREPLPVIAEEQRRHMGGPGTPHFDPDVLHSERPQLYWPEWWQFLIYAAYVGVCVLGAARG